MRFPLDRPRSAGILAVVLAGCVNRPIREVSRPWAPPELPPVAASCPFVTHPRWQILELEDSSRAVLSLLSDTCRNGDLRVSGALVSLRKGEQRLGDWNLDTVAFAEGPSSSPVVWAALAMDARPDSGSLRVCDMAMVRCALLPYKEVRP